MNDTPDRADSSPRLKAGASSAEMVKNSKKMELEIKRLII